MRLIKSDIRVANTFVVDGVTHQRVNTSGQILWFVIDVAGSPKLHNKQTADELEIQYQKLLNAALQLTSTSKSELIKSYVCN